MKRSIIRSVFVKSRMTKVVIRNCVASYHAKVHDPIQHRTDSPHRDSKGIVTSYNRGCLRQQVLLMGKKLEFKGFWLYRAWADQEGRTGPPPPPEKNKNVGFLCNTGPGSPEKSQSYQASNQCWAIIGPPAKRRDGLFIAVFVSSPLIN